MKRKRVLLSIMVISTLFVKSQTNSSFNPTLHQIVPPSPNASALGKFGEIPIGPSTGIPEISIPLYSYSGSYNDLNLSVSLNYHAGGIRVDEMSGNTGIGWVLNAGGVISRTMRGIYDEMSGIGFIHTGKLPADVYEGNAGASLDARAFNDMYAWEADSQNDIFSYSFNGRSGKFLLGKNNNLLILNQQKLRIEKTIAPIPGESAGYPMISEFVITDEKGYRYIFSDAEITHNNSMATAAAVYTSAWYITKIVSPAGKDSITFAYEGINYTYDVGKSVTNILNYPGSYSPSITNPNTTSVSNQTIKGKRVKTIIFPNSVSATFNYSTTERTEVNSGDYLLKKITITDGIHTRGYKLQHDYSLNRPTLKQVIPFATDNEVEDAGYAMEYDIPLPDRLSNSQDHWGFYNLNNNGGLIPGTVTTVGTGGNYGSYFYASGGNRDTHPVYGKAGSLKRITYPTGGFTEFEMEVNKAADPRLNGVVYAQQTYSRQGATMVYCSSSSTNSFTFLFEGDANSSTDFKIKIQSSTFSCSGNCKVVMEIRTPSNTLLDLRYFDPPNSSNPPEYQFSLSNLIPGTSYTIKTYTQNLSSYSAYMDFKWIEKRNQNPVTTYQTLLPDQLFVGGLRVKKIKDYDGIHTAPSLIREYEYVLKDNITSSGTLGFYPAYVHPVCYYWGEGGANEAYMGLCNSPNYLVFSSSTVYPLSYANGSPVAYKRVVEKSTGSGGNNGRRELYFRSFTETPVNISTPFPFTPPEYKEFWNGLLDSVLTFDANNQLVKKEISSYNYILDNFWQDSAKFESFRSVTIAPVKYQTPSTFDVPRFFLMNSFYPTAGRADLIKSTAYEYSNNSSLKNEITYVYDTENLYLKSKSTVSSKGKNLNEAYQYPKDMISTSQDPAGVYQQMVNSNIISPIITHTLTQNNIPVKVLKNNYYTPFTNLYMPKDIELKIGSGSIEKRVEFTAYNNRGAITSQQKTNDTRQSYLWGYNSHYPIASVVNAAATDIFHTSFEEGDGNSSNGDSKTGRKSKTGGYSKALSNLTPGQYILSYWQKSGGTWTFQKSIVTVTGSSYPIALSGQIDEVRFYPKAARMNTYTYEPLVGITSQCNENDEITSYEYDSFGRLQTVRDKDGRVIKTNDYQYHQPNN